MNENMPSTNEASVATSFSQSSQTNDVIDLTDFNDSDECEVTSSSSVTDSNSSINPQQPESNPAGNWRKNSNSSADDSICILYEKILPPPDIEFLNEVVVRDSGENAATNHDLRSIPVPPIIMGSFTENPVPFFPRISDGRTSSSSQPIDYSSTAMIRGLQQAPHHSSLPSCKYAISFRRPPQRVSVVGTCSVPFQPISLPVNKVPLQSKALPDNLPSQSSGPENSNTEVRVPKIQCGICLDGPDEIAESNRNFTSTNCGHVFCNICITTSLKKANKCPNCRKKVTSRQIHPLYL